MLTPYMLCYIRTVQKNAETCVRAMLRRLAEKHGRPIPSANGSSVTVAELSGYDLMDDGTQIAVRVRVDTADGSAEVDFSECGYQVLGNTNTPRAVCVSALLYCLRCLVEQDIPLNEGCLAPVRIIFPPYPSIIAPSKTAAVVGGNVLTSQRVTDVILVLRLLCESSRFLTVSCVY